MFLSGALEHGPELGLKLGAGFACIELWTVMLHRTGPLNEPLLCCHGVSWVDSWVEFWSLEEAFPLPPLSFPLMPS